MVTIIRQLLKITVSVTILVVLIITKKLHEDFGILKTGRNGPKATRIMNTFPDSLLVLLIYRFAIETSAAFCVATAIVQAVVGIINTETVVTSAVTAGITAAIYVSYRKTLIFFIRLEETITLLLREKRERR